MTTFPPGLSGLKPGNRYCRGETLIEPNESNITGIEFDTAENFTLGLMVATFTESYESPEATFTSHTLDSSRPDRRSANVVYIALYAAVLLMSVIGNSLVIFTIASNKRMRNLTNIFLLSMAISDLLFAVWCMPINLTGRVLTRFIFGPAVCRMLPYIGGVSVMVSTYTMSIISIERYYAICRPFGALTRQTKKHAYRVTALIWLVSFCFMLPYAISNEIRYRYVARLGKCVPACRPVFANKSVEKAWYTFLLVGLLCLPGIVMAIMYIRVCITLRKRFQFKNKQDQRASNGILQHEDHLQAKSKQCENFTLMPPENGTATKEAVKKKVNDSPAQISSNTNNTRTVVMLIMIVIFYFCFWTPLYIANAWRAFDFPSALRAFDGSIEIIKLMSYVSTCVNPVIYCFMNKKFREGFIKAFLCCLPTKWKQKVGMRPFGHSNALSETQQVTLVSSARLPRRSMSPV